MLVTRFKKNRRGITLVELILAMALTAIIMASCARLLIPMYKSYNNSVDDANAIKISGDIERNLRNVLSGANEIGVTTSDYLDPNINGYYYLNLSSNRVEYSYRDETEGVLYHYFLSDAEYEGFYLNWNILPKHYNLDQQYMKGVLKFELEVYNDDVSVERTFTVQMNNLTQERDYLYNASAKQIILSTDYTYEPGYVIRDGSTVLTIASYSGRYINLNNRITNELIVITNADKRLAQGPISILDITQTPKNTPDDSEYKSIRFKKV